MRATDRPSQAGLLICSVGSECAGQVVTFVLRLCSTSQSWACCSPAATFPTSCFLLILFLQSCSPLFFNKATLMEGENGGKSYNKVNNRGENTAQIYNMQDTVRWSVGPDSKTKTESKQKCWFEITYFKFAKFWAVLTALTVFSVNSCEVNFICMPPNHSSYPRKQVLTLLFMLFTETQQATVLVMRSGRFLGYNQTYSLWLSWKNVFNKGITKMENCSIL